MSDSRPIGIFDSGIGGLTVCKAIRDLMPAENIIYFGDTMRFPYGTRSAETVVRYAREISAYFLSRDVKMVVCACNTASAVALPALEKELPVPVCGVIKAGARAACSRMHGDVLGVIGTRATVHSEAYIRAVHELRPGLAIRQQQATVFVTLVEEGWTECEVARLTARNYLQDMYDDGVRTLMLGGTHFPLLKDAISSVYADIDLVDTGQEIAREVQQILDEKKLAHSGAQGTIELYASDITDTIRRMKTIFFGNSGVRLEQLIINEKTCTQQ
jgi:glutamate racemase